MRQKLISVIGPRKSGRTTVLEKIHYFRPEYQRVTMWTYALSEFCNLHNISVTEFFLRKHYMDESKIDPELNMMMFSLFCEYRRKEDSEFSLKPILDYISNKPKVLMDEVYYYNELAHLIGLDSVIIYVDTDRDIRIKRGLTKKMEETDISSYVTTIQAREVKNWKNTHILNNDREMNFLHTKVQELVEDLNL